MDLNLLTVDGQSLSYRTCFVHFELLANTDIYTIILLGLPDNLNHVNATA